MKIKCKACNTVKILNVNKLIPYKGKTISTKCANKQCTHRIKFKVPQDIGEDKINPLKKNDKKDNLLKKKTCSNCGTTVSINTRFCTNCGKEIKKKQEAKKPIEKITKKETVLFCEKCGTQVKKDQKFCLQCGEATNKSVLSKVTTKKPTSSTSKKEKTTIQQIKSTNKPLTNGINEKKGSFFKSLLKLFLGLVILVVSSVIGFLVYSNFQETTLQDGPWITDSYMTERLYNDINGSSDAKRNIAIQQVNLAYKSYLDSLRVTAPLTNYDTNPEPFFLNEFNPIKKGNLYFFKVITKEDTSSWLNIVLDLKSEDYFEAKAYFIANDEVSIGYIRGRLKK